MVDLRARTPRSLTWRPPLIALLFSLALGPACQCGPGNDKEEKTTTQPPLTEEEMSMAKELVAEPPAEPPALPSVAASGKQVFASGPHCEEPDCQLSITFTQPMAKDKNAPTPAVSMRPALEGSWAWSDPSTLTFTPKKGTFGHGQNVEIDFPRLTFDDDKDEATAPRVVNARTFYVRVPYLRIGMKVAYWPVVKGAPRVVIANQVWSGSIGQGPLVVGYDQPIDLIAQAEKVSVTTSAGTPVKFEIRKPKSNELPFDPGVSLTHFLALDLDAKVADGEVIVLSIPSFYTKTEEGTESYRLTVNRNFALSGTRASSGNMRKVGVWGGVMLDFTTPISLERAKAAVKITPAPETLNLSAWGQRLNINGQFAHGTEYTVTIADDFKDALGNVLKRKDADKKIVFRTQDLSPRLRLPNGPLTLEAGHDGLPFHAVNVSAVSMTATKVKDPAAFAKALAKSRLRDCNIDGARESAPPVSVTPKLDLNEKGTATIELEDPGLYCASLTTVGRGSQARDKAIRGAKLVQVSTVNAIAKISNNSVFAWVTTLKEGKPVAGADVTILTPAYKVAAKGKTKADGSVRMKTAAPLSSGFLVVAQEGVPQVVSAINQSTLTAAWKFGQKASVQGVTPLRAALFTERGVYRPGNKVYLKLAGHPDIADTSNGGDNAVSIVVNDSRGRKVLSKKILLDTYHSASHTFTLSKEANVGVYSVNAKVGRATLTHTFRVEEYRVPTFEVRMNSEQKKWQRASDIEVVVDSRYMHGARMPGREISYTVTREPVPFETEAFPTYTFAVAGAQLSSSSVTSKNTRLDGMGQKVIRFAANHPSSAGPMRYVVDATVTDVDRQAYAGRIAKTVHPARFYVGVQTPSRSVVKVGETITADFAAVFTNGKPMTGAKLKARLERVDHHQTARVAGEGTDGKPKVEVDNHEVKKQMQTCEVITRRGKASCKFDVKTPGQYRVRVWGRDKSGRDVQAGYTFRASGSYAAAWPRYERARIDVIADKAEYVPGDVAKLIVESPFKVATGLLTVEQDGVKSARVFNINNDTPALEVPITAEMAPNVYASVVLTRGRIHDEKDATGFETGAPSFRIGVVNLAVRPDESKLAVAIEPKKRAAAPGQKVGVDVVVKDNAGAPVQSQVTLMVVDEAVLGMTRFQTPDALGALNRARGWDVRTLVTLEDLPNSRRERKEALFPGGDGGDGLSIADFPAELRKLFDSTALFVPNLVTDAQGRVSAEVTFPDNLTTYRIMAIVVDKSGRAGSADNRLTVRKPLMVQPVLPRFVYPGDALKIEALVINGSDDEGEVTLLTEVEHAKASGDKKQGPKSLEHGQEHLFGTNIVVPETLVAREGTEIVVRFAGTIKTKGGQTFRDAVEKRVPVLSPGTKRTAVVSQVFAGEQTLSVDVEGDRVEGSLNAEVIASATMLSELKDAVQYLLRYPYGCIEQTTSTAYPLVLLEDLLPEIGVEVDRAELKKFRDAGIKRILSFQTTKGGLSYWPGEDKPHAFATAFGLTALLEAKKQGISIPQDKLDRMAKFLEETLRKPNVVETIAHGGIADADSRALFVMTLGRMGRPQHSTVSALWRDVDKLGPFGLSFLATAIEEGSGDKALLEPVLEKIKSHAEVQEAEAYFESKRKGGYSMDSPLRSHAGALLAYATAAPSSPLTAKLLKGLLARRRGGMWGNTQENVFGMMAVAKLSRSQEAEGATAEPTVTIGGKSYSGDALDAISSRVKRVVVKGDATGVTGTGAGELEAKVEVGSPSYVTLRTEWEAALTDENRKARSNGFRIERTYESESGSAVAPDAVELGKVIRVRLKVVTEREYNYVAVDDKLPAGMEPMNMNLATTAKASLGEMTKEREAADKVLSFQEMRDHRVTFFADALPPGTYEFVYLARATIPGTFIRPAARAEAMYDTDRNGNTRIDVVKIR